MTEGQRNRFFMPEWQKCVRANGWHTSGGFAVVDEARLNEEGRQAVALARQRARMRDGALLCGPQPFTLSDLRHGCYIVAIRRDKETEHLSNDDQDRIVALFKLLADPDDLAALQNWQAYQRGENPGNRKRRKWFIKSRAPEAVSRHIAMDLTRGRTKDLESLSDQEESNLARVLAQRPVYTGAPKAVNGKRNYQLDPNRKFEPRSKRAAAPQPEVEELF